MTDYSALGLTILEDFITEDEEKEILSHIEKTEKNNKTGRNSIKRYGSNLPYKSCMVSVEIPEFILAVADKIFRRNLLESRPDSVTVNEYFIGQSITPHIDSKESGPVVTILGLLSEAMMRFEFKKEKFTVNFPARCLIQMRGDIRDKWMHSIEPVLADRYSLVFRTGTTVPKSYIKVKK